MDNEPIAAAFRHIADQLELEGANPFRIRAYRRAADQIVQLREPLSSLAREGRIRRLPGIGRDLEKKILDLLGGRPIQVSPAESSEPSSRAPFQVPGLDPKLAALFHNRFGIETVGDLERLARSRMLRTLPEMGVGLERKILEGIEKLKKSPDSLKSNP